MKHLSICLAISLLVSAGTAQSMTPIEKGIALHLEGRFSEALRYYSQALTDRALQEDIPRAMLYSAFCYQQIGNYDMALKALWQIVGDYPGSDVVDLAYFELAKLRERQGSDHFAEALILYETVLSRHTRSRKLAEAYLGAARVKIELGYHEYADETLQRVIERLGSTEETAMLHYDIAQIYANPQNPRRDVRKALDHLDIITTRFWGSDAICQTYLLKAKLHWETGNLNEALRLYREITIQFPGSPSAEFSQENIAKIYEEMGDLQRAVNAYRILQVKYSFSDLTRQRLQMQIDRFTAPDESTRKPTISAWKAVENSEPQRMSYEGDVEIRMRKTLIQSDTAEVIYQEGLVKATGNVRLRWGDSLVVHCDSVEFSFSEQAVRCFGNILIKRKDSDGIVESRYETIHLGLDDGRITEEGKNK